MAITAGIVPWSICLGFGVEAGGRSFVLKRLSFKAKPQIRPVPDGFTCCGKVQTEPHLGRARPRSCRYAIEIVSRFSAGGSLFGICNIFPTAS
jgi:hypothetical protein